MRGKRILAIGLALTGLLAFAAIRTDIPNKATQLKITRPVTTKSRSVRAGEKAEPDYVLYRDVVRKDSWLVGVGAPLSQEEANRLPYYFRLSMKNDKGHYQFVEAMHGDKLTTDHPLTPYILDKNASSDADSESVREWREKLRTVAQWFLTSDLSGDVMVEERAYEAKEKDANMIYAFQPVRTDANHATASFLNDWGLPVDVSESDDHYYGNVVAITYASDGTDSIVDFLDGRGLRRYDEFGVDQRRYVYDDRLRLKEMTTCNVAGVKMDDSGGVCGVRYDYDDNTPFDYTMRFFNRNGYLTFGYAREFDMRFKKAKVEHDRLGRPVRVTVVEEESVTSPGRVYMKTIEYTPTGQVVRVRKFDHKGEEL